MSRGKTAIVSSGVCVCVCPSCASQTLEQERDRAEDRLKIEQTQRDSIELLRQRNKELEEQLRSLCKLQVSGVPLHTWCQ